MALASQIEHARQLYTLRYTTGSDFGPGSQGRRLARASGGAKRACFDGSPGDVRQSAGVLGGLGSVADRAQFHGGPVRSSPEPVGPGALTVSHPFSAMMPTPRWAGHGHIAASNEGWD
jgi:hypothetical protein